MTVKELIEKLREMPENLEVNLNEEYGSDKVEVVTYSDGSQLVVISGAS